MTLTPADLETLLARCTQCGRVKLARELRASQRGRIERGVKRVRCEGCIEGTTEPLDGFKRGAAWWSTYREAFG